MAKSAQWFAQAGGLLISRLWVPQDMKVALMKPTYVPDVDANLRWADVSAQEIAAGGGYTAGGKSLTGKSTSYDAAANEMNLVAADLSWGPGFTATMAFAVVYEEGTTDKFLWGLLDLGGTQTISNGTFLLDWA